MSGEVSLEEVLAERERHSVRRAELAAVGRTVVQLTISTPGSRKDGEDIRKAARFGAALFERVLSARGLRSLYCETRDDAAGSCCMWVIDADAVIVKKIVVSLESGYSLGRLWDFDVYGAGGSKLDREAIGSATRTCFVCGSPAAVCAGRRLHEMAEVERRFHELLTLGICDFE